MDKLALTPAVMAAAEDVLAQRRIPRATYRVQFGRDFTFNDARALVPYLDRLGISDCYASPLLRTSFDTSNPYSISDYNALNPALGTERDFHAFASAIHEHGMGLLLDVVPNHMGIDSPRNTMWMDVLESGPSSVYAPYFDIDWHPVKPELANKLLLPILEDQYGIVLETGKLRLAYQDGSFFIHYYRTVLPVAPTTYASILSYQLGPLAETLGEGSEQLQEFQSILTAISHLPPRTDLSPGRIAEGSREKEVIKRRIAALYEASPEVREAIDASIVAYNGRVGGPASFDLMDALLDAQAYRLAYWRVAAEQINYRRFFDINELAAVRVELPEVFEHTHRLIFELLAEGKATGLRIDHPDGLFNPRDYFRQVQEAYVQHSVEAHLDQSDSVENVHDEVTTWMEKRLRRASTAATPRPLYVVAEKILSEGESLPTDWEVYGTTGYDFLNAVNSLFVDGTKRRTLDRIYSDFISAPIDFRNLLNSAKKMIMLVSLVSESTSLGHNLERLAERNRRYRDFTLNSLIFAIREIIAGLPVYRTYIVAPEERVTRYDRAYIEAAVAEAKTRNPRTAQSIFDFVRDILLLQNLAEFRPEDQPSVEDFVMKFQQATGPVMAKGLEDTAFYIYNRLASLNEVGGNPERFGISLNAFHRQNEARLRQWPHSLLATSTHDTKRGEDVRARIDVLSEIPGEWRAALTRWSRINASKKAVVNDEPAPDRNDEYLLYQTLLGAWPWGEPTTESLAQFRDRIAAYMLKATKEAKVHTSWINPNEEYDAAVRGFVYAILSATTDDPFLTDFLAIQKRVAYYGQFNSLAQVLLKLTAPGVPDIYQGCELWDLSLVDPDNRRPVDYDSRRSLLADIDGQVKRAGEDLRGLAKDLLDSSYDGRIKLYLTYRALNYRRAHDRVFSEGGYVPLEAVGEKRSHVCAYARVLGNERIVVVAPRLVVRLTERREQPPLGVEVWKDAWLALPRERMGRGYRNLLTGEVLSVARHRDTRGLPLAALCKHFPVALLERMPMTK